MEIVCCSSLLFHFLSRRAILRRTRFTRTGQRKRERVWEWTKLVLSPTESKFVLPQRIGRECIRRAFNLWIRWDKEKKMIRLACRTGTFVQLDGQDDWRPVEHWLKGTPGTYLRPRLGVYCDLWLSCNLSLSAVECAVQPVCNPLTLIFLCCPLSWLSFFLSSGGWSGSRWRWRSWREKWRECFYIEFHHAHG